MRNFKSIDNYCLGHRGHCYTVNCSHDDMPKAGDTVSIDGMVKRLLGVEKVRVDSWGLQSSKPESITLLVEDG